LRAIGKCFRRLLPLLLLLTLPAVVQAQFTFTTNNGALTITRYTGPGGVVVIPDMTNGLPVTRIGDNAFDAFLGSMSPTSVTIPDSVTNIGNYVFNECLSLANVTIGKGVTSIGVRVFVYCLNLNTIMVDALNSAYCSVDGVLFSKGTNAIVQFPAGSKFSSYSIPNSVTTIGNMAFYQCSSLTNVAIPNTVTSVGDAAFYFCTSLASLTLPNNVTSIGGNAFYSCSSLTSITIPNGVTWIGSAAFEACSALSSVTIPNGVTSIEFATFDGCGSLTNVMIPNSVTSIGYLAFYSCGSLTSVVIPDSVTYMGDTAFRLCTSLSNVTIGNNVTGIGSQTFDACYSLTNVTIGTGVTSIGSQAFNACYGLTSVMIRSNVTNIASDAFTACTSLSAITVDPLNCVYSSADGVLFDKNQTTLVRCPGGRTGSYTVPSTVTNIGSTAFSSCTSLVRVTIPSSVTSIGISAFDTCTSLASVTLPNSITSIPSSAFSSCSGLTNVTIPNSVTRIGNNAFWRCSSLVSVTIPNGVTSIETVAFQFCSALTSVTIGSSVADIGGWAFFNCPNLTAANFQGNAPNLGSSVFTYDNQATIFYLPGTIGWGSTFGDRPTALWRLPYPLILNNSPSFGVESNRFGFIISWVTNLSVVVEACTNLGENPMWVPVQTNSLPNGWSYFGDPQWTNFPARFYRIRSGSPSIESCFTCATNNGTITITGYLCSGGAVSIPGTISGLPVAAIGSRAFIYNSILTSVTIPDSVTSIGDYAFALCSNLTNVMIGNGVTWIGVYAFEECGLSSVTIPSSVTSIAGRAFDSCSSLKTVYFKGTPPGLGYAAFQDYNTTLYYLPGTMGWSAQVQTSDASFGVRTNRFGFTITGNSGLGIVVEACTNLAHPAWSPVQTITLSSGSSYFSDPQWTNYPRCFYRVLTSTFGGLQAVLWNPQAQTGGATFSVRSNQFGFNITGTANIPIVIEACTNPANPIWLPLQTCTLTNGSIYFSDPDWTNYPTRLYRVRSP
jgi:hypothetical protein